MYLTDVIGLPIRDRGGAPLARTVDLIVRADFAEPYPPVTGLVARLRRRAIFVPWEQIGGLDEHQGFTLTSERLSLEPFRRREGEVLLARDVLDKQLVDVEGRRVVRANDLQLALRDSKLGIVAVDISGSAIIRRLLPRRLRGRAKTRSLLDWKDLEVFGGQLPTVKLKMSHERLARLHPRDIARIVDSLSYRQGAEIVEALDAETAAETLEEMSQDRQVDLLEGMDEERAADILEEMGPDEAADVLADLSDEKAESLLEKMDPEWAEDVRDLMRYEEDTAGGIMTTDVVAVPVDLRVGEAARFIREQLETPDVFYYVYAVDNLERWHLDGVITLRDLLMADPDARLSEVMETNLQVARSDDDAREVARRIAEYNLLALPVADEDGILLGAVTFDDAMDLLLPEGWKRRVPRVFG